MFEEERQRREQKKAHEERVWTIVGTSTVVWMIGWIIWYKVDYYLDPWDVQYGPCSCKACNRKQDVENLRNWSPWRRALRNITGQEGQQESCPGGIASLATDGHK